MKIATPQPIDPDFLMSQLQQALPHYKFTKRTSKFIVAEKTAAVGANVLVGKNKVTVAGNFPNMGLQIVFMLAIVFLGVLIPLVIYFIALYGKQKASAGEVGAMVQAIATGQPVMAQPGMVQPGMMAQPAMTAAPAQAPAYAQPQVNPYGQPPAY